MEAAKNNARHGKRTTTILNARIHPLKKDAAMRICEQNGVTVSDYLKECVEALVREHLSRKDLKKLLSDCGDAQPP